MARMVNFESMFLNIAGYEHEIATLYKLEEASDAIMKVNLKFLDIPGQSYGMIERLRKGYCPGSF
jgi:hypothetical protein